MKLFLKRLASRMPSQLQQELRKQHHGHQVRHDQFSSPEVEFGLLHQWVKEGDWALDLGANIGHYTAKLSNLVGPKGRVIAFEPFPKTFEILVSNVANLRHKNVTLVNAAASENCQVVHMDVPQFDVVGLENHYLASVSDSGAGLSVLSATVDSFAFPKPITLVKIDVEGHEFSALQGMKQTLLRDHPRVIIEGQDAKVEAFLKDLDYDFEVNPGSPNRVFYVA